MKVKDILIDIFISNLISAVYQVCLIRELGVIYTYVSIEFVANVIINLTFIGFGIGALLSYRYFKKDAFPILIFLSGIFMLFIIFFILRGLPLIPTNSLCSMKVVVLTSFLYMLPLIMFGAIFAYLTEELVSIGKKFIPIFVSISVLGVTMGYFFAPKIACFVGVHTLLVVSSLLAIISAFPKRFFIIPLLILPLFFPIEKHIDKLWLKKPFFVVNILNPKKVYSGWSPYHKVDIYTYKDGKALIGLYNFRTMWLIDEEEEKKYPIFDFLYRRLITPSSDALLICTGGAQA